MAQIESPPQRSLPHFHFPRISRLAHGISDYFFGGLVASSPLDLRFHESTPALAGSPIHFAMGGKAGLVFVILGIMQIAMALLTRRPRDSEKTN